jgi:allophanate hydrolase
VTYSDDIGSLDAVSLRQAYSSGRLIPEQVVDAVYDRIASRGQDNVWISLLPRAAALAAARAVTSRYDGLELPPLYGLPFGVKDNIDVAGLATTAAFPPMARHPEQTAAAVQPLLAAGAILIGKTNLDQFATGLSGTRSPYGTPVNPFDPDLIPGGSSSGSAVAVSAGLVSFAIGSDTAGSGRVPAAFSNTVGIKPSRGLVSTAGMLPACPSLDCPSVFALTVADAALVTSVMADAPHVVTAARPPAGLRLAIPQQQDLGFAPDSPSQVRYHEFLESLVECGVVLEPIPMASLFEAGDKLYGGAWVAERYAAIASLAGEAWDEVHPDVREVIERGPYVTGAQVFSDQLRIAGIQAEIAPVFERCAALLTPTVVASFTLREMLESPIRRNADLGRFTAYGNLLALAAIALPAGFDSTGVPFGITLAAPAGWEAALTAIAACLEQLSTYPLGATAFLRPGMAIATEPDGVLLAVVGAHLSGMPLHADLIALGAELHQVTTTAAHYRLFALPDSVPEKPALLRVSPDDGPGHPIDVEVYRLTTAALGELMTSVPPPLAIGSVELADGSIVHGFVCEPYGLVKAADISSHGGWRAYRST